MKYLYLIILTVFITSCWAQIQEESKIVVEDQNTIEVTNEINNEISNLDVTFEDNSTKITKLDAKYTNPAGEVDMVISYSLDSEWKIDTIDVSATTYDLKDFNTAAQVLVGKTIDEAKDTEIAGWSLTTHAFKDALK